MPDHTHPLDHRIPPPILALIVAGLVWLIARFTPHMAIPSMIRLGLSSILGLIALTTALWAFIAFRRAKNTVDPTQPSKASSLVIVGIFHYTRNPMYLALTLLLIAWTVRLAAPIALLGPVLFALYTNRFQIIPEERAMAEKFGEEYARYRATVRRWV